MIDNMSVVIEFVKSFAIITEKRPGMAHIKKTYPSRSNDWFAHPHNPKIRTHAWIFMEDDVIFDHFDEGSNQCMLILSE